MTYTIKRTETFIKWHNDLKDQKAKSKISVCMRKMELGNFGDVKPVGSGISETRIHYGPGYRIYFFIQSNVLIIILAGGDKHTQTKDILQAMELKNEYA